MRSTPSFSLGTVSSSEVGDNGFPLRLSPVPYILNLAYKHKLRIINIVIQLRCHIRLGQF